MDHTIPPAPASGRINHISTGIPGFDTILGGGLPAGSLYMIQGLAGSGKTTLACQMGFLHAKQGKKVLVLTLIAESHAKMLNHLSSFSFFDERLVGEEVVFFSGYNELREGGLRDLLSFISAILSDQRPEMFIVDGFRSVRDSSPSDLALSEFMHSLNSLVASMGCTTFLLSPVEGNAPESENTLVDGLIELSQHERGMRLVREVKVFKIRGGNHLLGKHVFQVKKDGLEIYPRFEAVASRANVTPPLQEGIAAFGVPSWDKLIGGGVKQGSTTNLLGTPGVGKTTLGMHFIGEGLRRGENCLVVGFYESPPRMAEKAHMVGLDMNAALRDQSLAILWQQPLEVLIDELAAKMLEDIDRRNVRRVFIDGVEGLCDIVMYPERARSFQVAISNALRARGVTTCFTQELPYFLNTTLTNEPTASALFENVMLLQYVEIGDTNHRQIRVMKLREHGYDHSSHVMKISDRGITIEHPVAHLRSPRGATGED